MCVYVPYLMQRSGGPLIQLTSLMRIMSVPWVQHVCNFPIWYISFLYEWQPFIHMQHPCDESIILHPQKLKMLTHPYAVWECFRADLVPSVCICINGQPLTTTCIHLQPSNITCLKHMFTSISFYLKFEDSIDRIQSNDGSEYKLHKNLVSNRPWLRDKFP